MPPLAAIDQLYQARQIIVQIAETRGLRATLHPSPFSGIGTAAHVHVSLNNADTDNKAPIQENIDAGFWAGVLNHLQAICAFSLPERDSYKRVVDNSWTGGTWIAWGTQNRETPLRKVSNARWEIRCMDGCANMFLAMSAVVGAGLLALRKGWGVKELGKDCDCKCTLFGLAWRHLFASIAGTHRIYQFCART
jgi:glutamine synthetase